jgi:hypothetical protein
LRFFEGFKLAFDTVVFTFTGSPSLFRLPAVLFVFSVFSTGDIESESSVSGLAAAAATVATAACKESLSSTETSLYQVDAGPHNNE